MNHAAAVPTLAPTPRTTVSWTLLAEVLLPIISLALYLWTGPQNNVYFEPVPQADAFLHGRLHLVDRPSWAEVVVWADGTYYLVDPPAPAALLAPMQALIGYDAAAAMLPNFAPAFVGAASVALAGLLLRAWGVAREPRLWLTMGFALSALWWVAGHGGSYSHVFGVFFTLAALNLAVRTRWPVAAGLLLGLAAGSRLPMGLALPVLLVLYGARPNRSHLWLLSGLAVPALAIAWYNLARFGDPFQFGYGLLATRPRHGLLVTDEPWYSDGIVSLSYIPRSLALALFGGFEWDYSQAPYLRPSPWGAAITLTSPFLLGALFARGRMALLLGATAILVMLPNLAHGQPGLVQFGYRFINDAAPVMLLMLGLAFRTTFPIWMKWAVVIGAAMHAYGFWTTQVLGFVADR